MTVCPTGLPLPYTIDVLYRSTGSYPKIKQGACLNNSIFVYRISAETSNYSAIERLPGKRGSDNF